MPLFGPPNIEKLKVKGNIKGLIKALGYKKDATIRREAANALGQISAREAEEALITAFVWDKDEDVCKAAAHALKKIGVHPVDLFLHEETLIRSNIAEALGRIRDKNAVEPLIASLEDEYWGTRESAAKALGDIGNNRAVEPLIKALKDENWTVRENAAKALGKIGDKRAQKPLKEALNDEDWHVKQAASDSLKCLQY